jgi:hypothetical protein
LRDEDIIGEVNEIESSGNGDNMGELYGKFSYL